MAHPTINRLNREWEALAGLEVPTAWRDEPALCGPTLLGELPAAVREQPDEVLGALLRITASDALAARVVLQVMLGKVVLDASRDRCHDVGDYLGELWPLIVGYPLARRPSRIAANLALDTRKRVWRRDAPVALPLPQDCVHQVPPRAAEEVDALIREAGDLSLIDGPSQRALRLVYQDGLRSEAAAAELGISGAAVRQRCRRAIARLACHAEHLAGN